MPAGVALPSLQERPRTRLTKEDIAAYLAELDGLTAQYQAAQQQQQQQQQQETPRVINGLRTLTGSGDDSSLPAQSPQPVSEHWSPLEGSLPQSASHTSLSSLAQGLDGHVTTAPPTSPPSVFLQHATPSSANTITAQTGGQPSGGSSSYARRLKDLVSPRDKSSPSNPATSASAPTTQYSPQSSRASIISWAKKSTGTKSKHAHDLQPLANLPRAADDWFPIISQVSTTFASLQTSVIVSGLVWAKLYPAPADRTSEPWHHVWAAISDSSLYLWKSQHEPIGWRFLFDDTQCALQPSIHADHPFGLLFEVQEDVQPYVALAFDAEDSRSIWHSGFLQQQRASKIPVRIHAETLGVAGATRNLLIDSTSAVDEIICLALAKFQISGADPALYQLYERKEDGSEVVYSSLGTLPLQQQGTATQPRDFVLKMFNHNGGGSPLRLEDSMRLMMSGAAVALNDGEDEATTIVDAPIRDTARRGMRNSIFGGALASQVQQLLESADKEAEGAAQPDAVAAADASDQGAADDDDHQDDVPVLESLSSAPTIRPMRMSIFGVNGITAASGLITDHDGADTIRRKQDAMGKVPVHDIFAPQ